MYYTKFETTFCDVILAGDNKGLSFLHLETNEEQRKFEIDSKWIKNDNYFEQDKAQILEYFENKRKTFNLKINPKGTDFQQKVWNALIKIPYGKTLTYKDIAIMIGNKNASRAVGMANSKNPIPLIIPCHRVIGANGELTGFAPGLALKEKLINLERTHNE